MDQYPGPNSVRQIKDLRVRLGLSQQALAAQLGVSFATVNRWEKGHNSPSNVLWDKLRTLDQAAGESSEAPGKPVVESPVGRLDFTGHPDAIRALVEGERLSFGHLVNPVFATETSRIHPLPHQRLAVYEHLLKQPRLRFLLADDAGAGKTIMTGLYIREMSSRRLLRRVLVVPPAGLVGNWQRELLKLFSLQFEVVSGSDATSGNPFAAGPGDRVIVSIDTLRSARVFARLRDPSTPPYDLVIFDEAHKLTSDRDPDFRVRKTDRYKLAEALAGVRANNDEFALPWSAHHLLLLTATPHMGKDYPYYALWKLLAPDELSTLEAFESFPIERRNRHFLRRTKEEMVKLDGKPLYPKRLCNTLGYELSQTNPNGGTTEQQLYDRTSDYMREVYNQAKILNRSAAQLAMSVFQRRLASSTFAMFRSFERRLERLDEIIEKVQKGEISEEQLINFHARMNDAFEAKTADEEEAAANGREENEVVEDDLLRGVLATSLAELQAERELVVELRAKSQQVLDAGTESKFDKLREILEDAKWVNEKLIIFTEHRDTLEYLVRRLEGMGHTGRIAQIHGGMHFTERDTQVERFRAPTAEGGARFMVCTDAAAEGINLQFCWIMINYDVPWNPARLEQRMGRIHRYGQEKDPVVIINLVATTTREGKVLTTLLEKLERIRRQLRSDKVFDSIGRLFQGVSIKHFMDRLLDKTATLDEVAAELDGKLTKEQVEALVEQERRLYGDGGDVARSLPGLRQSLDREVYRNLLPGYVRQYIQLAVPRMGLRIEGDPQNTFSLRADGPGTLDALTPTLEAYPAALRQRLTFVRPVDPKDGIWIHPGEPLFEAFRDLARTRLANEAVRGAIFVDPTAEKPYLIHVALVAVARQSDPDLTELSHRETLECRLVAVRQQEGAELTVTPVEHLLLLRDWVGAPPTSAQLLAIRAEAHREQAAAYLAERIGRQLAVEHRERLQGLIPERESFLRRGFDFEEAELATARARWSAKARTGDARAKQEVDRLRNRQADLDSRRNRSLAVLHREPELILSQPIELLATALIVPSSDAAELKALESNAERIAMQLAIAHEQAEGAQVLDVHTPALARAAGLSDNPGFDILSLRPGGERRCIEVKGRSDVGQVEVTANEWARACNARTAYWLYVVYHCATPTPHLTRVQDPFARLLSKAKGSMLIDHDDVLKAGAP